MSDVVFSLGRVIQVQPHELWNSKLELLAGFGLLLALEIRAAGRTADWAFRFVLQEFLGQNIDLFLVSFNKVVRTSEFIAGSLKSFDLLIQSFMYFQIIDFLLLELAGLLLEVAQLKADIAVSQ